MKITAKDVAQGDTVCFQKDRDRHSQTGTVITVKAYGDNVGSLIVRVDGITASNVRVFPEDVLSVQKLAANP